MKKVIKFISKFILGVLVLVLTLSLVYSIGTGKNLLKVTAVELLPNTSFNHIVRGFETYDSEHITWYYPKGNNLSQDDIKNMEKAYEDACQFWGLDAVELLGKKLRFAWLPGESKYDKRLFKKSLGKSGSGRALPTTGILYSIYPYTPHELNHMIAGQISNSIRLLNEGFADYLNKKNWYRNVYEVLLEAKNNNKLIPIKDMLSCKNFNKQDSRVSYAEASLFTQFLVEEKGIDNYKEIYQKLTFREKEEVIISTFEEVYEIELNKLIEEWELYLDSILDQ